MDTTQEKLFRDALYLMNSRPGVTATMDMAVLPGVLGPSFGWLRTSSQTLRRTVEVRLGNDFGFTISDFGFKIED